MASLSFSVSQIRKSVEKTFLMWDYFHSANIALLRTLSEPKYCFVLPQTTSPSKLQPWEIKMIVNYSAIPWPGGLRVRVQVVSPRVSGRVARL